ncbi:hypothetical protein [Actinocorallia libanotica]|uniref:Uncharacterized protein n=1 Tax=Actinocorallia libanotica TaxID=46162 RepID=A0ABN1Q284_9ACTN
MAYVLVPPIVDQVQMGTDRFAARYLLPQGITLIMRQDGSVYERTYPSQDELNAAADFWLGGHRHPLTDPQRDALVSAGYADFIHEE